MASIITTNKNVLGAFNAPKTSLTGSDTLTYNAGMGQELILVNTTASVVDVTIDGASGTTVPVPGAGATTFSVAAGLVITVPANDFMVVRLDTVHVFLQGAVSVTGGTGVSAIILQ